MKIFFTVLIVLGFLILGTIFFTNSDTNQNVSDISTTTSQTASDNTFKPNENNESIPNNYRLHAEPELRYSLYLPPEIDVSSPRPKITRYRFVGPENEASTEIIDGYTITVMAEQSTTTKAKGIAVKNIQENESNVIEEPASVTLAKTSGVRYVTESQLGDKPITNYVLTPGNDFAYTISTNIIPADSKKYRQSVNQILGSIQFLSESEAQSLASRIVPIAMLDYPATDKSYVKESSGKKRGCDKVVLIEQVLAKATTTPLTASLEQLFAYRNNTVGGWQNFIASQNNTLFFNRVEIIDSTAHIYLTGKLGPLSGICDNSRATVQIEETALAYDTVDSVQLYLNGEPTTLTPDGR